MFTTIPDEKIAQLFAEAKNALQENREIDQALDTGKALKCITEIIERAPLFAPAYAFRLSIRLTGISKDSLSDTIKFYEDWFSCYSQCNQEMRDSLDLLCSENNWPSAKKLTLTKVGSRAAEVAQVARFGKATEEKIAETSLSTIHVRKIHDCLSKYAFLEQVEIKYLFIKEEVAQILGTALKQCKNLTHLTLTECELTNDQASIILEAIVETKCMVLIDLSKNRITSTNGMLSQFLAKSVSIQTLNLNSNYLSTEEADSLSAVLKTHPSLTHLNIACYLSCELMLRLALALKKNRALSILDISNNKIIDSEIDPPNKVLLELSNSLTLTDIRHPYISRLPSESSLIQAMSFNKTRPVLSWGLVSVAISFERANLNHPFAAASIKNIFPMIYGFISGPFKHTLKRKANEGFSDTEEKSLEKRLKI